MSRAHIALALFTAVVAVAVLQQIVATFGFPKPGSVNEYFESLLKHGHQPVRPGDFVASGALAKARSDGSQYLLGVGKADITGYVQARRRF
jgi:hypothetical protein